MTVLVGSGRPGDGYRTTAGRRVPSVTTVIGRFKLADPLLYWVEKCSARGVRWRDERDNAATIGTCAHDMIERHLVGRPHPTPQELGATDAQYATAERAFANFLDWWESQRIEILATEIPLVSERHEFGGTVDAIGRDEHGLLILDWKTSNSLHADYIAQVAAYCSMWNEQHPDQTITRGRLLRFSKEQGFQDVPLDERSLSIGWDSFLAMLGLYKQISKLEKLAEGWKKQ